MITWPDEECNNLLGSSQTCREREGDGKREREGDGKREREGESIEREVMKKNEKDGVQCEFVLSYSCVDCN